MTRTFIGKGIEIVQQDLQQILLRGKGDGGFADTINKEVSLLPPTDNLRMINNDEFLFAKQAFDQWSLVCLKPKSEKEFWAICTACDLEISIIDCFSCGIPNTIHRKDPIMPKIINFFLFKNVFCTTADSSKVVFSF